MHWNHSFVICHRDFICHPASLLRNFRSIHMLRRAFRATQLLRWRTLGVSDECASRIQGVGFPSPTLVQQNAIPLIHSRTAQPTIVHAEPGSGKTIAYLAPLMCASLCSAFLCDTGSGRQRQGPAVILCPNADLCDQVTAVARSLQMPLVRKPRVHVACNHRASVQITAQDLTKESAAGGVHITTPRMLLRCEQKVTQQLHITCWGWSLN